MVVGAETCEMFLTVYGKFHGRCRCRREFLTFAVVPGVYDVQTPGGPTLHGSRQVCGQVQVTFLTIALVAADSSRGS